MNNNILPPEYFEVKEENERLKKIINEKKKRHKKVKKSQRLIKTIAIVEAVALMASVGVPNILNASHRKQGRDSIVTELEDNNMIPRNMEWIDTDRGTTIKVDGEELKITSYVDYLIDVYNDALEDGCSSEKMAVAFSNADVPSDMIERVTGCDRKIIKNAEFNSYYEMQLVNEKSVGGISK